MINRASVLVCGNARKSAGPAKWPRKKKYCQIDSKNDTLSIRFYLLSTQRIPRGRDPILFIQTFRAAGGGDVDEDAYFYLGKHVLRFPF